MALVAAACLQKIRVRLFLSFSPSSRAMPIRPVTIILSLGEARAEIVKSQIDAKLPNLLKLGEHTLLLVEYYVLCDLEVECCGWKLK